MHRFSYLPLLVTSIFLTSCTAADLREAGWTKEYAFDVSFSLEGDKWVGNHDVANIATNDDVLTAVTIRDKSGTNASRLIFASPANSDGHRCKFVYPDIQGLTRYSGNTFSRRTHETNGNKIYEAGNVSQTAQTGDGTRLTTLACPVNEHLGLWVLEVEYPSASASEPFVRTFNVTFWFE